MLLSGGEIRLSPSVFKTVLNLLVFYSNVFLFIFFFENLTDNKSLVDKICLNFDFSLTQTTSSLQ